jgi:hypothetical protein
MWRRVSTNRVIIIRPHLLLRSLTVCKHFGIQRNVQFYLMYRKHGSKNWPDGDYVSKHVAIFITDNKITCILTEATLRIFTTYMPRLEA